MMETIRELLNSKKFMVLMTTVLGLLGATLGGAMPWSQFLADVVLAVAVYLGAQGLADLGKSAAQVKAATPPAEE